MIGTQETGKATQEASQITEEAFRQVRGPEPITPGLQARLQESDGGMEALPESVHKVGRGARAKRPGKAPCKAGIDADCSVGICD
jgi:hypothetical protein